MPDINLIDDPGFQETIHEPLKKLASQPEPRKKKAGEKKKFRSFRVEEIISILIVLGIGILAWWYFSLKILVQSEIREYPPHEFITKPEL